MSVPIDVKAGSILFLPEKDPHRPYSHVVASDSGLIEDGQYNHPVLIFAVNRDKTRVLALIVHRTPPNAPLLSSSPPPHFQFPYTNPSQLPTAAGRPISTKFRDSEPPRSNDHILRLRRQYLPIYPAPHPDLDISLHLANNLFLKRNSYINIGTSLMIETRLLRSMWEGPRRLKKSSFKELQKHVPFTIPDGFSVATPSVPPVSNEAARTRYQTRLYGAINERSVAPSPVNVPSTPLQTGLTTGDIRRLYGPQGHQSTTPGPVNAPSTPLQTGLTTGDMRRLYGTQGHQSTVVRPAYVAPAPVRHYDTPAAVYRAPVPSYEAAEEEGRDPSPRPRFSKSDLWGLVWVVGIVGLLTVAKVKGWA